MQPFLCGKWINIIYSQFGLVALVIQHGVRMHLIVICGLLAGSIKYSHITSKTADFRINVAEPKMCVLIFLTNFV
jgi:hypothetical protein